MNQLSVGKPADDVIRKKVFGHYGLVCACCGTRENLTIDHVDGGGWEDRAKGLYGRMLWLQLINNGFPEGFQTLCGPCNSSKSDGEACRLDHSPEAENPAGVKRCPNPDHTGLNPLPVAGFNRSSNTSDGRQTWCKTCHSALRRRQSSTRRTVVPWTALESTSPSRLADDSPIIDLLDDREMTVALIAAGIDRARVEMVRSCIRRLAS
jgi:hypothetical protein